MKRRSFKEYFVNDNSYLITGLVIFIILFLIILFTSQDWKIALTWSGCTTILALILLPIRDFFGIKRHRGIHSSKLFQQLIDQGFKSEAFGKYLGLIKKVGNGTIRIYYDWNKTLKGPLSFGDIVINIYYEPLVHDFKELIIEKELVKSLNNRFEISELGTKRMFTWDRIIIYLNYYSWTKTSRIMEEIDRSLKILANENMQQLDLSQLNEDLSAHQRDGGFMPHIDLIWQELDRSSSYNK